MRILYFAKAYPPETGGIETYSEQVAMAYSRDGHEVTVITTHPGEPGTEMRGEITVHNVGQGPQAKVFWRMMKALRGLKGVQFDCVHSTTWRAALPAVLLRSSLPLVLTIHGREVFVVPKLLRPAMNLVLRRARFIPTVSQAILDKFQETLSFQLAGAFANWNGISFEEETRVLPEKAQDGPINIFCMCRLVDRKNVRRAIQAVAALIREGHDLRFDIAGGGPLLETLQAQVSEEGMEAHIQVLGRVPDEAVDPLYRKSHIFLHPQIATLSGGDLEGFGLTIADGMSYGAVPIAGASGGPLDFIEPGVNGYLVDGENLEDIKNKLRQAVSDRKLMTELAGKSWACAHEKMTWKNHVRKIIERVQAD